MQAIVSAQGRGRGAGGESGRGSAGPPSGMALTVASARHPIVQMVALTRVVRLHLIVPTGDQTQVLTAHAYSARTRIAPTMNSTNIRECQRGSTRLPTIYAPAIKQRC